jgi:hypothetical protein
MCEQELLQLEYTDVFKKQRCSRRNYADIKCFLTQQALLFTLLLLWVQVNDTKLPQRQQETGWVSVKIIEGKRLFTVLCSLHLITLSELSTMLKSSVQNWKNTGQENQLKLQEQMNLAFSSKCLTEDKLHKPTRFWSHDWKPTVYITSEMLSTDEVLKILHQVTV